MRLKKGDEVRSHRDCPFGGYKTGDIFTITAVDGDFIVFVDNDGNGRLRPDDEFELLPVAEATGKPAFKVGDRVKVGGDHPYILSNNNTTGKIIGGNNGRRGEWEVQLDNYGGSLSFKTDELKRLSSPLTIETGKFYRTRDGRKVGPIGWNDTYLKELFPFVDTTDISDCWSSGGKFLYPGHPDSDKDLIAEWIDEPVATASADAASNDNASVAKFKVGDIVKRAGGFMSHQRLRITKAVGDRYSVEWLEGGPGSIDNWRGYEFELVGPPSKPAIVARIESGQPKPSEKPKVHKNEVSATDEAERLAVKYPGQKFGVFVLADSRIADVVMRRAA